MRALRTIFFLGRSTRACSRPTSVSGQRQAGNNSSATASIWPCPAFFEVLGDIEESFIADLDTIISTLVYGLLGRFTAGEIDVTEILPILDRAVFCLTSGYEAQQAQARDLRPPAARITHQTDGQTACQATTLMVRNDLSAASGTFIPGGTPLRK